MKAKVLVQRDIILKVCFQTDTVTVFIGIRTHEAEQLFSIAALLVILFGNKNVDIPCIIIHVGLPLFQGESTDFLRL